jgi:hypothetical protein
MENFNTLQAIIPDWLMVTDLLTIDYPIRSITIENIGDVSGLVLGKELAAGEPLRFEAGANGYYPANVWVLNPKLTSEAVATTFKVLINK